MKWPLSSWAQAAIAIAAAIALTFGLFLLLGVIFLGLEQAVSEPHMTGKPGLPLSLERSN